MMVDGVEFTDDGMSVTLLRSKTSVVPQVIRVVRALDGRVCPVRLTREFPLNRGAGSRAFVECSDWRGLCLFSGVSNVACSLSGLWIGYC